MEAAWTHPNGSAWVGGKAQQPGGPSQTPALTWLSTDATTYAHFLFNAFDADGNGAIRFEVGAQGLLAPGPGPCDLQVISLFPGLRDSKVMVLGQG